VPSDVIAKLNAQPCRLWSNPSFAGGLLISGKKSRRAQQTPEALGAIQQAEIAKWLASDQGRKY
jgi:hypothetical protein